MQGASGSLGEALASLGDRAQAEAHLLAAIETLEAAYADDHRNVRRLLNQLASLYERVGEPDRALRYRQRLAVIGQNHDVD